MKILYKNLLKFFSGSPKEDAGISGADINSKYPGVENTDERTLLDLFENQAITNPQKVALIFKERIISYQQLNDQANQLAHFLQSKGVKKETFVPLFIERSIEMVVSILAILKAGGAFVPIDPEFPAERIKYILKDLDAQLLVTSDLAKSKLKEGTTHLTLIALDEYQHEIETMPKTSVSSKITPGNLAYIIYTSGSTGTPKGVLSEHRNIYNYLLNSVESFISPDEERSGTFLHIPFTFDASLKSLFTPLVSGKSIVISSLPSPFVFEDSNLHRYAPYDFIQLTPSHLEFFYAEFWDKYKHPITGKVSIGGEALYRSHFDYLIKNGGTLEVVNEYGPTETTVACTGYTFKVEKEGINAVVPQNIPIGKGIKGVQIYLLNENGETVGKDEEGEICVGGFQVARGYLNQPELTKLKFIPDTFEKSPGATIYRTGDVGRWLPDGNLEYIGRIDKQVKIRGYRVELGEIESLLLQCPQVKNAVVEAVENKHGEKELVTYIIPDGYFSKADTVVFLKERLPHYFVPDKFVEVGFFPVTTNGKIDRSALLSGTQA